MSEKIRHVDAATYEVVGGSGSGLSSSSSSVSLTTRGSREYAV